MKTFIIGKELIIPEIVETIAHDNGKVELSSEAKTKIKKSRDIIEMIISTGKTVYGVNTGFGKFADVRISPEQLEQLQKNLVLSHAAGVGEPLDIPTVRAMMFLKIISLSLGFSGVRESLVELLVEMLNQNIVPVIPKKGSVGASGDLAPLAHLALVMIGEGESDFLNPSSHQWERLPGSEALKKGKLSPIKFSAKEGLAILNGTQAMTAIGCLNLVRAENLCKMADISGAMSTEALLGTNVAFDARIHRARGHKGQIDCAENLTNLLAGSPIVASHRFSDHKVQDAYSLRCMPQVHGAIRDTLHFVRDLITTEINGASDNPLIFDSGKDNSQGDVLSGGNFHGEPVAMAMDYLAIAVSELANISERRIESMCDPSTSEMAGFLTRAGGLNSGFMIAQVTAAALVSENKIFSHPASVDSIPTSANKEDHVSMGMTAAVKAQEVMENAEHVIGIEFLCAAQGIDLRKPLLPGKATGEAYRVIRREIPFWEEDRLMHTDLIKIKKMVNDRRILKEVEKVVQLK